MNVEIRPVAYRNGGWGLNYSLLSTNFPRFLFYTIPNRIFPHFILKDGELGLLLLGLLLSI